MTLQPKYKMIKSQLDSWQKALAQLRAELSKKHVENQVEVHDKLAAVQHRYELARDQFDKLTQLSGVPLDKARNGLDSIMLALQVEFVQLKNAVDEKTDIQGWAEGFVENYDPSSIGWAEGMAQEGQPGEKSIGWAEGMADEDPVESVGWAEGYKDKKVSSA